MRTTIRIAVTALILLSGAVFAGEPGRGAGKGYGIHQNHRPGGRCHPSKRSGGAPHIWTGVQSVRDVTDGNYQRALDRNRRMIAGMARKKSKIEGCGQPQGR